jgi:3-dehydroquinate synthetase
MMTRARMTELKNALDHTGWEITDDDLFFVEDEKIIWHLLNEKKNKSTILVFYLFDDLGRVTERLSDILYVDDEKENIRLYFSKINTSKWKVGLRDFARSL